MKKIKIVVKKDICELRYPLIKEQHINEWAVLNTASDKQNSFLPVVSDKKKNRLTVSLKGYCSLEEYLPMVPLTSDSFIRIAEFIIRNISEAEKLHLSKNTILLDPAYVMICPSEISVKLICLPVEPFERSGNLSDLFIFLARHTIFRDNDIPSFLDIFLETAGKDETSCFLEMEKLIATLKAPSKEHIAHEKMQRCPSCNSVILKDSQCPNCGYDLKSHSIKQPAEKTRSAWLQQCSDGKKIPLFKFPFLIGKSEIAVDYTVKNRYVSNIHAELGCEENIFYIADRQSTNGTFINGVQISPHVKTALNNTDKITLGNESFIFRID